MSLVKYEQVLLTKDVKRTFEENYLKMLFEKHRSLPKEDIVDFLHKAQMTGANPALQQVFLIERNNKQRDGSYKKTGTTVFSYNFIQAVANTTGEYEGYTSKIGIAEKFDINEGNVKKMLCCHVEVKRKGHSFPYTAWWDEYVQKDYNTGKPSGTWKDKPYMMLEKVALSGALRRAFPEALSGMYCEEEMESIENNIAKEIENKTIESAAIEMVDKKEKILSEASESYDEKNAKIEAIKMMLGELTKGQKKEDKSQAMKDLCSINSWDEINKKSLKELDYIIENMKAYIAEKEKRELLKSKHQESSAGKSAAENSFKLEP